MLKKGDQIELTIDRLSSGGRGVGRFEGFVVFVPDTAPEERVLAEIQDAKKSFAEARLIKILHASPHRVVPPCVVAGICGGCTWQHVAYSEQLMQKKNIVADAFRKFGGRGPIPVEETRASATELSYRTRIQVHYRNGEVGFFRRGSHDIIPVEECGIADTRLNKALLALRERLRNEGSGPVRLELSLSESGEVAISDEPRYEDELGFAQVNLAVNELLIKHVIQFLRSVQPKRVFDLYAGAGNFALPIAREIQPRDGVIAVELHSASVRKGREKAASSSLSNVSFVESSVDTFLTSVLAGRSQPVNPVDIQISTVVLDPPRAGCSPEVMKALNRLRPELIIYISCDPVTLARDIGRLPKESYTIERVTPFDMFPQTDHVETVAILRRQN